MTPGLTQQDGIHGGLPEAIPACEFRLRDAAGLVKSSQLSNKAISHLGVPMLDTPRDRLRFGPTHVSFPASLAALGDLVQHVVELCTQEEMIWSTARFVVALVTDLLPVGDGAVGQDPGHAMSKRVLSLPGDIAVTPRLSDSTFPDPTPVGLLEVSPEFLGCVHRPEVYIEMYIEGRSL